MPVFALKKMCLDTSICICDEIKTFQDFCSIGADIVNDKCKCDVFGWSYTPNLHNIYEDVPIALLERLNLSGLVTTASQPGEVTEPTRFGCNMKCYQRAVLNGFCSEAYASSLVKFINAHYKDQFIVDIAGDCWSRLQFEDQIATCYIPNEDTVNNKPDVSFASSVYKCMSSPTVTLDQIQLLFSCGKQCMQSGRFYHCLSYFGAALPPKVKPILSRIKRSDINPFAIMDTQWGRKDLLWEMFDCFLQIPESPIKDSAAQ